MRNHSQRSMNRLKREGGFAAPSPGRIPRGAKKIEISPASRSIPSDWYDEKSWSAAMHDRKSSVHSATLSRGQAFAISSSEQSSPAQTTMVRDVSLALIQNSVGAYHSLCSTPYIVDSSCRY